MPINLLLTLYRLAVSIIKVAKKKLLGLQQILPEVYSSSTTLKMGTPSSSERSVKIFPINIVKKTGLYRNLKCCKTHMCAEIYIII
jgi:hypothetical protein